MSIIDPTHPKATDEGDLDTAGHRRMAAGDQPSVSPTEDDARLGARLGATIDAEDDDTEGHKKF